MLDGWIVSPGAGERAAPIICKDSVSSNRKAREREQNSWTQQDTRDIIRLSGHENPKIKGQIKDDTPHNHIFTWALHGIESTVLLYPIFGLSWQLSSPAS